MESQAFSALLRGYLLPISAGPTLESFLKTIFDPKSTAPVIASTIHQNQAYAHFLQKLEVLKQRKKNAFSEDEEAPPKDADGKPSQVSRPLRDEEKELEKVINLLGKGPTRNAMVCLRMSKNCGIPFPKGPNDKIEFAPRDMLKLAITAEEYHDEHRMSHSEKAFLAGLHYDWLALYSKNAPGDQKLDGKYVDAVWKEAFRTARLTYEIGSLLKFFKYSDYAFAAGLVVHVGKLLMAMSVPGWKEFETEKESFGGFQESYLSFLERKKLPVTHSEMSALFISFLGLLPKIDKSIQFYAEPYYLKKVDKHLYSLALILNIAVWLSGKTAKGLHELPVSPTQRRYIAELGLTEPKIFVIFKMVGE